MPPVSATYPGSPSGVRVMVTLRSIACQSNGSGWNIHNSFALQRLPLRDAFQRAGVS
jgi:hypothetical protein